MCWMGPGCGPVAPFISIPFPDQVLQTAPQLPAQQRRHTASGVVNHGRLLMGRRRRASKAFPAVLGQGPDVGTERWPSGIPLEETAERHHASIDGVERHGMTFDPPEGEARLAGWISAQAAGALDVPTRDMERVR